MRVQSTAVYESATIGGALRVLLTPVGSAGDNLPFIGLGAELLRRGHDVTVATTDHFADLVRDGGMRFLTTGSEAEYEAAANDPDLFDSRRGFPAVMRLVGDYNRRLFDIVTEERNRGPLSIVAHTLDFASRVIADRTGLPVVRVHLQPAVVRTSYRVPVMRGTTDLSFLPRWFKRVLWWFIDHRVLDPAVAPFVNELRARVGLAPTQRIFVSQIDSPLLTIAMFPDWYAPPQPDWPLSLRQCGFPLFDATGSDDPPSEAEQFLAGGPAPIVFTPGSAMRYGQAFFEAAIGACARLGRRGLLLTRYPEQIRAPLPAGVAHFDYAPLSTVLPRCGALVHHGGVGTTAAGLAAGLPQVIVPFSHDQPDNAYRVQGLGTGRRIEPCDLDAERLAGALEDLLGSTAVGRRCAEIAALCAARDGIHRACDLIESAMLAELRRG